MITTIACNERGKPVYALEGSVFIGGAVIQWLRDELKIIENASETENIAKNLKNNAGVYVVPAFSGLGAPYWNMQSKGMITGLTRGTNYKHIIRASLESIAFQVNDLLECLSNDIGSNITKLKVDGGATENNFLMQFQSDISNVNINKPKNIESTALGAALLAGIGSKYWENIKDLKSQKLDKTYKSKIDQKNREKLLTEWTQAIKQCIA